MIGQTISHYRVLSQIGAGGMGVVYAGEDARLGRPVALKFVPEDLAKDLQAIDRLKSEARTASALNHPNICTIYDIGEHDGRPFIVMELLEGQSLRERLSTGPLRVQEALNFGIQIADALDSAHRRKIIHRDLKPENLFLLDRGRVKILDFGLAKLTEQRSVPTSTTGTPAFAVTAEGMTLGTVAYMSPEQVTGETLDGRSDLFSFGVVLYECVTGTQPFRGKTSGLVLSNILSKAPVAPAVFNPDLPMRLQEVINNCLEKDRELRYQDAAALRTDLMRIKRDLDSGMSGVVRTTGDVELATTTAVSTRTRTAAADDETADPARSAVTSVARSTASHSPLRSEPAVAATPPPSRRNMGAIAAAGVVVLAVVFGGLYIFSNRTAVPPPTSAPAASGPAPAAASSDQSAIDAARAKLNAKDYRAALTQAEDILRTTPDQEDALRIRNEARAVLTRFDEAIVRGNRQLGLGDTAGASAALNEARAIDPAAPAVSELSAGLLAAYQGQAAPPQGRGAKPSTGSQANNAPAAKAPPSSPAPSPSPTVPAAQPSPVVAGPPAPATEAAVQTPPPTTQPVAPPRAAGTSTAAASPVPAPAAPETPERTAPTPTPRVDRPLPAATVESDDTAIRRLVATYARAIEEKDLRLFRSVKPNLSADEQRGLEEGFKAVSSQKVEITIVSIKPSAQGQEASVVLKRRDTIQAAGRQQTVDGQQTLTLARTANGWVIRAIGR